MHVEALRTMIRRRHPIALAIAPAWAGLLALSAAPAAASSSLPFSVTVSGSGTWISQDSVAFDGSGTALLLGRVTNSGLIHITGADDSCPGGLANVNTEVLTAANGDTLTLTSQDVSCPSGPGTFTGSGSWWVSGGSGRFQGSSGRGTGTGSGDFNIGTITNTFRGTITLTHS